MIKYIAVKYGTAEVYPVEVDRETGSSVWVGGRRRAKRSDHESYFDTWEEARNYVLIKAQVRVDAARRHLEREKSDLGNIKGMKPPAKETPHD